MAREFKDQICAAVFSAILALLSPLTGAQETKDQGFDFSDYDRVLKTFVNEEAMVHYRRLKAQRQQLDTFVTSMGNLTSDTYNRWSEKEKIAFWLNAYNGLTLKAILDNYPIKSSFLRSRIYPRNSIRQIQGVWKKITFEVMGQRMTLDHIEHQILRAKFDEPGIHMAMVCAAMGCPPLRGEPYVGSRLDKQLDDQTRRFLGSPAKFKIDRSKNTVYLSPIFDWFAEDFVRKYGPERNIGRHDKKDSAVLNFVALHLAEPQEKYVLAGKFKIKYLKYDWSLNEQPTKE